MKTETAITLINQLSYKPGYRFEAHDYCHRFEDTICLTIHCPTWSTDRKDAQKEYQGAELDLRTKFLIQVGEFTSQEELFRAVLDQIIKLETHEAREFLRVGDTKWAPFHPHKAEGQRLFGDVAGDMAYGLVP